MVLVLKAVVQNDAYFMDVILLYLGHVPESCPKGLNYKQKALNLNCCRNLQCFTEG